MEPSLSYAVTFSLVSFAPGLAAVPAAAFPVLPPLEGVALDPVALSDLPGVNCIVFDGSSFFEPLPFLPFFPFFFFFFFSFLRL